MRFLLWHTLIVCIVLSPAVSARQDCGRLVSTPDISACIDSNLKEADAQLNSLYSKLMGLLEDPSSLRRSERAWIAFRDANCEFLWGNQYKSERMAFSACLEEKTLERTKELQDYLDAARSGCGGCPRLKDSP
jgi:uncharacterized protein YecT (DUF1311 family)